MNEQEKAGLEEEMKEEAKQALVAFLDQQQRALAELSEACEAAGTPEFHDQLKEAGRTSLAGFRQLLGNFSEMATTAKEAGLCEEDATVSTSSAEQPGKPKRKRGKRLRVRVSTD